MLLSIPRELVELVVFHAACPTPDGRPNSLKPLRLTCRVLNDIITTSNDVHAKIFRSKFSYRRHAGLDGLTSAEWRFQLACYDRALTCIQSGEGLFDHISSPTDAPTTSSPIPDRDLLWMVYIMCLDDDDGGANKRQLNSVGAYDWIRSFILDHLMDGAAGNDGWPLENEVNSLALWIFWYLTTKERLLSEPEDVSERIVQLVLPYVVAHFRYATAWVPPNHFYLPLPSRVLLSNRIRHSNHFLSFVTPHGPFPKYRELESTNTVIYARRIHLTQPLATIAAKLLFFGRREIYAFGMPPNLPRTRLEAPGHVGPTQEDISELNRNLLGGPDGRGGGTKVGCPLAQSEWARLRNCHDIWRPNGVQIYAPGLLTGLWAGRMTMMNEDMLNTISQNRQFPEGLNEMMLGLFSAPVYMRLEELLCPYGEDILPSTHRSAPDDLMDTDEDEELEEPSDPTMTPEESTQLDAALRANFDDGLFHAFLPKNCKITQSHMGRRAAISAPGLDREYFYHRYRRSRLVHETETCPGCLAREAEIQRRVDADDENETQWREVLPPCSGIRDVVLHGATDSRHAAAWNDYSYLGRVRQWDGMVTILRRGAADIVMYGYLTGDGNIVGNWRIGHGEVGLPTLEGAFTLGKVNEEKGA